MESLATEEAGSAKTIPEQVSDVLKSTSIGYLSVTSKKGDLYSYPVAYYYAGAKVYMMTPIGSAKMKFMKANPNVSFIVDNKKLALEACGAMVQGKAKILSMTKMVASIVSLGPKMMNFAKKYPGMFSFYAKGTYLPDERKLYKYRFIRIEPSKIVYWTGYNFGRYVPDKNGKKDDDLELKDSSAESIAGMLATADEELQSDAVPADADWLGELNSAVSKGVLSEDEMRIIGSYKTPLGVSGTVKPGEISSAEKNILKKWKAKKSD
jgi:nitroimidazol reductase NimA-like FMN-containing flavoprotein (pyridoxamine 5'-phosphate oxidase superfamily)